MSPACRPPQPVPIYCSRVEAEDNDEAVASGPAGDRLFTLRARICQGLFGDLRWRRILRVAR
jgi:hypothetical protein